MKSIESLSEEDLLSKTRNLVNEERKLTLEVLRHIREVKKRMLYARLGYSSLYDFCVNELHYSQGAAYRRLGAMNLMDEIPAIEKKIERGETTLSNLATLQSFFRAEEKSGRKSYNAKEKLNLIESAGSKSSRELERTLAAISPAIAQVDQERFVDADHVEIRVTISVDLHAKLNRIRDLIAHRFPSATNRELISYMAETVLKKLDPDPKAPPAQPSPVDQTVSIPAKARQAIPASVWRMVWRRDGGRCVYRDPLTGRQCGSRRALELDHILPWAAGGETAASNLRLLCKTHNQWAARAFFGSAHMAHFRGS